MKTLAKITQTFLLVLAAAAAILLLQRCAIRQPPPGGPEDKTPPQLLNSFPPPDSTNIRHLEYLEFRFDENVDRNSIVNQVWLLPELPSPIEVKWKGNKKFRIVLKDSLEKDQTYILTIGTSLKDLQGNNLREPIILPFSTGPTIDHGEISGRVLGENVQDTYIYAYQVLDSLPDNTIFEKKPRYYTQVGKSGDYQLKYLKPAKYRVYALDDQDRNRLYVLESDRIGIPYADIMLTDQKTNYKNFNYTLIREDSTGPEVVRVKPTASTKLEIDFNEDLDASQDFNIEIEDSVARFPLKVLAGEPDKEDASKLLVYTEPQEETIYLVQLAAVKDPAGNYSEGNFIRTTFKGIAKADTVSPKITALFPSNGQKNIRYDARLQITFSQPVDTASLKNNFRFLNQDSLPVQGHWKFPYLTMPQFIPDTPLNKGETYAYSLDLANVYNVFEKSFGDTIIACQFTTWDWAELGEISGTVYTDRKNWRQAIVIAIPFRGGDEYSLIAKTNRPYQIPFLPDGFYRMKVVMDVNENGRYDPGRSIPFEFAEPFLIYDDTVKVRKRWTTDGKDFNFNP